MKKILFFVTLFFMGFSQANILIETIYSCNNKSVTYTFNAVHIGSESQFKLLDKTFKIIVTSIEPFAQTKNKFVSFDFFEISLDNQTLHGSAAVACFPLHSDCVAQIRLSNKGDKVDQSIAFKIKETE